MKNNLELRYLDWDSEQLGIGCGLIDLSGNRVSENKSKLLEKITGLFQADKNIKFITIKLNSNLLNVVNELIRGGALLIDTELTFRFNSDKTPVKRVVPGNVKCEFCKTFASKPFIPLSKQVTLSRFFSDKNIPVSKAEVLWRESIKNHCEGFADELLVASFNDEPCGLVTLRFKENKDIFLHIIGVLENYQGRGIAPMMLERVTEKYSGNYNICIETQSINVAAQKAYKKSGFELDSLKYVLHYWRF